MLEILAESETHFSKEPIAAAGLKAVFRVLATEGDDRKLIIEVLSPRSRAHRVSQAVASSVLPSEIVFDAEGSNYVILRLQVPDAVVRMTMRALRRARFELVAAS